MSPEVAEALEALSGAVVTRVETGKGGARIIAVSDLTTVAVVLEGCDWADDRCANCSCDPDRVKVRVEKV